MTASAAPTPAPGFTATHRGRCKLLHIVAPATVGGLERVVFALATSQKAKGYDVHLVAFLETGVAERSLVGELRDAGVPVDTAIFPARSFRRQRQALMEVFARVSPDIVHSHGYLPDTLSSSLGARIGAVRVSTAHGFIGGPWRNRLYEWLQLQAYRRFDAVVAVSSGVAAEIRAASVATGRVHCVPNAWVARHEPLARDDARHRLGIPEGTFHIGWVGRISYEKGLDVLVEALPALRDLNMHVSVIGDGMERSNIERRTRELGVTQLLTLKGELPDAAQLFTAFDAIVLSSRREGTPIVLLEAMHVGVPIVATAVGGVPAMLSPREALLVPGEDSRALASAIRDVASSRDAARARAGSACERLAKDFALDPWINAYDKVYEESVSARAGG